MLTKKDVFSHTFTQDAYIMPCLFPDGKWRWVVRDFAEDGGTFCAGEEIIPAEMADTWDGLLTEEVMDSPETPQTPEQRKLQAAMFDIWCLMESGVWNKHVEVALENLHKLVQNK